MIEKFEFRHPKSKEIILRYALQFDDQRTIAMIERGTLDNETEGRHLAYFFWRMIDASVGAHDDRDMENIYRDLSCLKQFVDVLDENGELVANSSDP